MSMRNWIIFRQKVLKVEGTKIPMITQADLDSTLCGKMIIIPLVDVNHISGILCVKTDGEI